MHATRFAACRRVGESRLGQLKRLELLCHVSQHAAAETRTHLAAILQFIAVVNAQQQRAEFLARTGRVGIAGNHEFLPQHAFHFQPRPAPCLQICTIGALDHDTFHSVHAGMLEHLLRTADDVVAVDQRPILRRIRQERLQQPFAFDQRHRSQVVAVEIHQIENVICQLRRLALTHHVLQGLKTDLAVALDGHYFAVHPGIFHRQFAQGTGDGFPFARPVVAGTGVDVCLAVLDAAHGAIAVEFHFRQPVVATGCVLGQRRELRAEHLRHGRFNRSADPFRRHAARRALCVFF